MNEVAVAVPRQGQEGNRWVNTVPTAEELATWFEKNVKVEGDLPHADYVGGVVLIPATDKTKTVTGFEGAAPVIEEIENLVHTPYIRVETRLKYFHDLCDEQRWQGFIEAAAIEEQDPKLPPGYFYHLVPTGENRGVRYLCCSMQVTIYEKGSVREKLTKHGKIRTGQIVRIAPGGTKAVPLVRTGRNGAYADDNSMMKAETGAIGRALGMAGMLVIPGSGIATAEDVQEARSQEASGPSPDDAQLPEEVGTAPIISDPASAPDADEEMRKEITTLLAAMEEQYPETATQFKAWAKEKGYGPLGEIVSPQLRGLHRKATVMFNEAGQKKPADSEPEGDKPE
jgi:hypothetical protein